MMSGTVFVRTSVWNSLGISPVIVCIINNSSCLRDFREKSERWFKRRNVKSCESWAVLCEVQCFKHLSASCCPAQSSPQVWMPAFLNTDSWHIGMHHQGNTAIILGGGEWENLSSFDIKQASDSTYTTTGRFREISLFFSFTFLFQLLSKTTRATQTNNVSCLKVLQSWEYKRIPFSISHPKKFQSMCCDLTSSCRLSFSCRLPLHRWGL